MKIAKGGGLDGDPQQISDNLWRFSNLKNPNRSLTFNIVTNNFNYKYDWVTDPKALEGIFKSNEETLVEKAKTYLNNFKAFKPDLKAGTSKVSFWKIVGPDRSQVGSFSEANAVMVEFFRQDISKDQKFVELNANRSQVNLLLSPAAGERQLLEINYTYFDYNKENTATYPAKSGTDAYADLKSGQAYIAQGDGLVFESINISFTTLAYLNPATDTRVLQPVYVFKGSGLVKGEKKDFQAYVSAINPDFER